MQRTFDDLGTPLCDVTFCVLDLETTGGDRNNDLITEIANASLEQTLGRRGQPA